MLNENNNKAQKRALRRSRRQARRSRTLGFGTSYAPATLFVDTVGMSV